MSHFLQKTFFCSGLFHAKPAHPLPNNTLEQLSTWGAGLMGHFATVATSSRKVPALTRQLSLVFALAVSAPLALAMCTSTAAHGATPGTGQNGHAGKAKYGLLPAATYTAEQAERGAETYKETCALCHGPALGGAFDTPPLTGRFVANWSGVPLRHVFDYISHAMPLNAPGALSEDENADILAFLLRENGVPASAKPLPSKAEALEHVSFPHVDLTKDNNSVAPKPSGKGG